ncbi:hypothetical protein [Lysinibacillus sp. NPDC056232]|uniref:hypothetical protein n=1 Tax=Lysinibacillus sp. NPDC056232 TaxID=3345756 RepID=UPI0035E25568
MKKNKQNELSKKMEKILKLSQDNTTGISSIAFDTNYIRAYGLGPKLIEPTTAIYYENLNGSSELNGHILNSHINNTNNSKSTFLAIDNRDSNKPALYISNQSMVKKITRKSELKEGEKVLLYWEYGPYSFLVFSMQDPISKQTILECIFNGNLATTRANRYLFLNLLPSVEALSVKKKFENALTNSNLEDASNEKEETSIY